jgi:hypothetical protein
VKDEGLVLAFTMKDVNRLLVETWIVYDVAPGTLAQSNAGRRLVVSAPSAGAVKLGGSSAVRNVRTPDHRLYCPPELYDLTRHQWVVFAARSVPGVNSDTLGVESFTTRLLKPAFVDTRIW